MIIIKLFVCFSQAIMTGDTLPGDLDLLDLLLVTPLPIYVIINGYPRTTTTTTTTTTLPPDYHLWQRFDGSKWILYILSQMPEHYLQRNRIEGVEIVFETDQPNGLIWFTGNERDNMHLTLKVCRSRSLSYTTYTRCGSRYNS